jgi:drug/metabolite transporter (DMT)-like permease
MHKGLLYGMLLCLMMIWGFNVIAIKVLVSYFEPVTITAFRIFVAGLVVLIFLFIKGMFRKITKQELVYITLITLTGVLGHHFFLASGLAETTASNGGLILGLVPLTTSVFAMLFLGDRVTVLRFIGILLGFAGVTLIVLNGSGSLGGASIGDLYILLAVISQATSFVFIKKITKTLDARFVTGIMLLIGSILLFFVSTQLEPAGLQSLKLAPGWVWLVFLGSAVLATGLGHMVYNSAIHQLGAGQTAIFINLTPFFSLTGSYLFLGEMIYLGQIFGFIFIVAGVVLGTGVLEHRRYYEEVEVKQQ